MFFKRKVDNVQKVKKYGVLATILDCTGSNVQLQIQLPEFQLHPILTNIDLLGPEITYFKDKIDSRSQLPIVVTTLGEYTVAKGCANINYTIYLYGRCVATLNRAIV